MQHQAAGKRGLLHGGRGSTRSLVRPVALMVMTLSFTALLLPVANASVPTDAPVVESGVVRRTQVLKPPQTPGAANAPLFIGSSFAISPKLRRGYQLADSTDIQTGWFDQVVAYDLDTSEQITTVPLDPPAWGALRAQPNTTMAVDDAQGLLYVAYQNKSSAILVISNGRYLANQRAIARGELCANVNVARGDCASGLHILDAATLESKGSVRFDNVRVDGGILAPRILSLQPTEDGKLLAVVADMASDIAPQGTDFSPYYLAHQNLNYVLQVNPQTRQVDWIVRIDACRGERDGRQTGENERSWHLPYPTTALKTHDAAGSAVWVGCHSGSARTGTAVRIPLDDSGNAYSLPVHNDDPSAAALEAVGSSEPNADVVRQSPSQQAVFGPEKTYSMIADPVSGRFLMRVVDADQEVWWVFDTSIGRFVGTIGIGTSDDKQEGQSLPGFDSGAGRLYVLNERLGLLAADVRRTPLAQALVFPEFEDWAPSAQASSSRALMVLAGDESHAARLFVASSMVNGRDLVYRVIEDSRPPSIDPEIEGDANRTRDLDEVEGVTSSTYDGAARAYGARMLLVGGGEALPRLSSADPLGVTSDGFWLGQNLTETVAKPVKDALGQAEDLARSSCAEGNRDLTLAFVGSSGPAVIDSAGGRASAEPVVFDSALRADSEAPISRCSPVEWQKAWTTALFGRPPVDEPTLPWLFGEGATNCVSGGERPAASFGDPVAGVFAASVSCQDDDVSGWAHARASLPGGVGIGQATTSFRIYRDPGRGIVSRVESVVRGLSIEDAFSVQSVRTSAESWANGRSQPILSDDREPDYDPNCDMERSAGTCFQRQLFGFRSPAYSCGPCGDEARLIEGMNRAMGSNGVAAFREPDARLRVGSENGFAAAITKPDTERFADLVLNNDLLQTVVPGLELLRFAPPNRPLTGGGSRGRQVLQFAGVEVSSSYSIQCLLVYDEATNTCAAAKEAPGSLSVALADPDGKPLAGGAFELRADIDGDGLVGLADTLVPDGVCVTAADGTGTCKWEPLAPGTYLVSQVTAPPTYGKVTEPFAVELASGEARTVSFTNAGNTSIVRIKVEDHTGKPVTGARFEVYPDPDADGKIAPDTAPVAQCETGSDGVCQMLVAMGSYVLVQAAAPTGLDPVEPVAFAFTQGGQTAAVGIVNYASIGASGVIIAPGPIVDYRDSHVPPSPAVTTEPYVPAEVEAPAPAISGSLGGTVVRVVRAPGDVLRLLSREPRQAVAWVASVLILCLAVMTIRRRMQALELVAE